MQKNFCILEGGTWQGIGAFWSVSVCGAFGEAAGRRRDCLHLARVWEPGRGPGPKVSAGRAAQPGARALLPAPLRALGGRRRGAPAGRTRGPGFVDGRPWALSALSALESCRDATLGLLAGICGDLRAAGRTGGAGAGGLKAPLFKKLKFDSTFLWFVASF